MQGPLLWFLHSLLQNLLPRTSGLLDISPAQWNNLLSYSYLQSVPRAQIMVLAAEKPPGTAGICRWLHVRYCLLSTLRTNPNVCMKMCFAVHKCEAWSVGGNTRPQLASIWRWMWNKGVKEQAIAVFLLPLSDLCLRGSRLTEHRIERWYIS